MIHLEVALCPFPICVKLSSLWLQIHISYSDYSSECQTMILLVILHEIGIIVNVW